MFSGLYTNIESMFSSFNWFNISSFFNYNPPIISIILKIFLCYTKLYNNIISEVKTFLYNKENNNLL